MTTKRIATTAGMFSVLGAAALVLTGCTSEPAAPGAQAAQTDTQQVQGQPTAQVPACADGQLNFDAEPITNPSGATLGFKLNYWVVGASGACSLTGYPGVTAVTGGPQVDAARKPRGALSGGLPQGQDTPPTVVLDRNHGAQAVVETTLIAHQSAACPTYTEFLTTPPNTTDTRKVSVTTLGCEYAVYPVYSWSR
ncbi:DUF4232 domain-containing protein [Nocardia sp. NPDC005366]|uniref:DUF4232 domain-containing protein n=1 Tax=Nocardia sp. NPDC005366 TaxID=3156878 RepID=UPI0033AEE0B4